MERHCLLSRLSDHLRWRPHRGELPKDGVATRRHVPFVLAAAPGQNQQPGRWRRRRRLSENNCRYTTHSTSPTEDKPLMVTLPLPMKRKFWWHIKPAKKFDPSGITQAEKECGFFLVENNGYLRYSATCLLSIFVGENM